MTQQHQSRPLSEMFSLDGQVAVVTGGAMGIGRGIVLRLAEAGAAVVVADVDAPGAQRVADTVRASGGNALAATCDVSQEGDVQRTMADTLAAFDRVDVLVNNAGIYPVKPALELTAQEWDRVQAVNLRSAFLFSREFAQQLIRQGGGGAIINIGSIDSVHPSMVGLAAYDASKGGMLMFTRNFALEVAPHGIRVNLIAPGGIATEGTSAGLANLTPDQSQALFQQFAARVPLGRMGAPDEIAMVTLFLAASASSYMTGAMVVVDGGVLLR